MAAVAPVKNKDRAIRAAHFLSFIFLFLLFPVFGSQRTRFFMEDPDPAWSPNRAETVPVEILFCFSK
jgi:hypothetical protein